MDNKDYKKELEEAIERAKNLDSPFYKEAAEIIFPQLKETQEEKVARIIKASLKSHFDGKLSEGTNDVDYAECLAWVNKQLYKKPTEEFESFVRWFVNKRTENWTLIPSDDDIHKWSVMILNHAKEVLGSKIEDEPSHIFNVGDWCIDDIDGTIFTITKAENNLYTYRTLEEKEYSCSYRSLETDAHLWSLEDAKAGDVISTIYGKAFIYNGKANGTCPGSFCGINTLGDFKIGCDHHWTGKKVRPATKEESYYLFLKMREAGYVWRADKLKLVEVKPTTIEEKDRIDDAFTGMMLKESNQNSVEWTKSDDGHLSGIIRLIEEISKDEKRDFRIVSEKERDNLIDWFKSLKEKIMTYQQSFHNWSDRDRDMTRFIGNAITTDEASKYLEEKGVEIIDAHVWLDELKERTTPQNWSEYDSKMSSYIVAALDAYCRLRKERDNTSGQEELESAINWIHNRFKYLKPNQEFGRDSKLIEKVCSYLNRYGNMLDERDSEYAAKIFKLADELKSREVKSIWKPTPEQTSILWDVVCTLKHDNYKHTEIVESLYNELKKL